MLREVERPCYTGQVFVHGDAGRREMRSAEWFRTAEAARRLGVHPQTLRAWEREGVIQPVERRRGQRVYCIQDLERIRTALAQRPATEPEKGTQS